MAPPPDQKESFPCPDCDGSISKNPAGDWECSKCDWIRSSCTIDGKEIL